MKKYISFVFLCAVLFVPVSVSADDHIDRHAYKLDGIEGLGVYSVTFPLGGFSSETHIPKASVRGVSEIGDRPEAIHYYFDNGSNEASNAGFSGAILTSQTAPEKDGMFVINKGEMHMFTFTAILSVLPKDGDIYRLQMSSLPFFKNEGATHRAFNPAELSRHNTKFLFLHTEPDTK